MTTQLIRARDLQVGNVFIVNRYEYIVTKKTSVSFFYRRVKDTSQSSLEMGIHSKKWVELVINS